MFLKYICMYVAASNARKLQVGSLLTDGTRCTYVQFHTLIPLDFETPFLNSTNIMDSVYRGGRGVGWGVVGVGRKPKAGNIIYGHRERTIVCSVKHRNSHSVHIGCWQQFDTTCSLIYVRTYIHTYVHTYVRTYIHTYIRTYIYKRRMNSAKSREIKNKILG